MLATITAPITAPFTRLPARPPRALRFAPNSIILALRAVLFQTQSKPSQTPLPLSNQGKRAHRAQKNEQFEPKNPHLSNHPSRPTTFNLAHPTFTPVILQRRRRPPISGVHRCPIGGYNPPMSLPRITSDFPGIGGAIKNRPEDFFVQELPLYQPAGEGEHIYCEIQKVGLTTFDAIEQLGRKLYVNTRNIGYAGLKDARAVTRQLLSIQGTTPEAVMKVQIPNLTVQWAARHGNKLRLGHLAGNRFAIKIRNVTPTDVVKLTPVIELLRHKGMPNYFGEQRFGRRGDNHLLGAALVRGDDHELLRLLLGNPDPEVDDSNQLGSRKAYERGDLESAMHLMPRRSGMERRVLHRLIKTQNPRAAVKAVDEKLRRLWISALQSELFNQVLAQRVAHGTIGTMLSGDLAWKHDNGACFTVEDSSLEQARTDNFEISPTGPLLGYRMSLPQRDAQAIEQAVFDQFNLKPEDFRVEGKLRVKGARRPLRVQPQDIDLAAGVDDHGPHITIAFTLPPGSFATVLLDELMKSDTVTERLDMDPGLAAESSTGPEIESESTT